MPRKELIDRASGRLITSGPEEINATQPLLTILLDECGWDKDQIVSRPKQWCVPSSPSDTRSWPVDVAIFESAKYRRSEEHVRILCECKKPDEKSGLRQLKIYLDREPHARVGIWFNGIDHKIIHKTQDGYQEAPAGTRIPGPDDPLSPNDQPSVLTYQTLREAQSLVPVFRRIRDRLAAQDTNVNRDEEILPDLSSLLLLKILDEQAHRFTVDAPLQFQTKGRSRKETASHIRTFLNREVKKHADIFGQSGVRLAIDADSIAYTVEQLQSYRLLANDMDAVSTAFQVLRGRAYKGEEGQYFTPPSVVHIAMAAINPGLNDRIIDPACGSGSFLATALNAVVDRLKDLAGENSPDYATGKRDWSTQNLYAIDKDAVSVRLSKAYLSLLGDGSTHVFKFDALRPSRWPANLREVVQDSAFSVVMTNPPFGTNLRLRRDDGRTEEYQLCRKWALDTESNAYLPTDDWEARELGIVFFERCLNLLEDGGRLAIVLPDTYLFSISYRWFIDYICRNFTITHTINVPIQAFEPYCRAKTSILVLKKEKPKPDHHIIGMLTESYGQDKKGNPLFRLDERGMPTTVREDEMAEASDLLAEENPRQGKLYFHINQTDAAKARVLTASYYWRKPYLEALSRFANDNKCDLITIGELVAQNELICLSGHGSPAGQFKGKGQVPYVKVSDIKNWRINENPKYFIPDAKAKEIRGDRELQMFDLVTPTRASKNIGLVAVVMPWQTHVVLTKEIVILRCSETNRISPWLLLVMMSLRVVNDQFRYLVQMQTNREDLGRRLLELKIPIPTEGSVRVKWEKPAQDFILAQVEARKNYEFLLDTLDVANFVDRP